MDSYVRAKIKVGTVAPEKKPAPAVAPKVSNGDRAKMMTEIARNPNSPRARAYRQLLLSQ